MKFNSYNRPTWHESISLFAEPTMWGFLSKDPAKDFPYELGEAVGQVALENKYI